MYQRVGTSAYKANLETTLELASYLNHPEAGFKSVHVAGTNGKGSVSHMLASVFQEAGYKVGLYTSPHLKDFRERIKINGVMIPEKKVVDFVSNHQSFFQKHRPSFFEMTVGMAFDYFNKEKVDIAIIEVGLGGRLDSTNIVTPEVSVITNIGLDHTQFLGTTIPAIAVEKAGIIKKNIPVVIGETTMETKDVFQSIAEQQKAPIYFAEHDSFRFRTTDLKGNYQQKNQRTALKTIQVLQNKGWNISEDNIENGLQKVTANTGLLGRWQVLQKSPKIICDTAHNKEGLRYVLEQLLEEPRNTLHIVLGFVNDKDIGSVLPLFPEKANYYFCTPNIERGMDAETLKEQAITYKLKGNTYASVATALETATKKAHESDVIFVGGSTFVVAEVV